MSRRATEVGVPCLYRRIWQGGFGARGWKLASTANDPEIIASTAATGERIPTSVFVHDILDHLLCAAVGEWKWERLSCGCPVEIGV